jgi:hypothetical protein
MPTDHQSIWGKIEAAVIRAGLAHAINLKEMLQECDQGSSLCLASDDGAVILTIIPKRDEAPILWVDLAVGWGEYGAFARCWPEVEMVARDLGCSAVEFRASRSGWERLARGWTRQGNVFRKELQPWAAKAAM